MKDAALNFLVSLATAVVVLFILGPTMMRLNGVDVGSASAPAVEPAAPAAPSTAAEAAPAPTPATSPADPAAPATPKADELTAPNLEGLTVRAARERWRDHGIVIIEDGERIDATVDAGTIIEQIPSAGAPLAQKEVRVVVAKQPELITVPDVVGGKLEDARKMLVDAGFEVPEATELTSTQKPGTVIRQDPNAGGKTEPGTIVRLTVAAESVEVPKLRGKPLHKAKTLIEKAGLEVGSVKQREDPELSGRRVLSQTPKAGEAVAPGTKVDLVIVAPD